MSRVFALNVQLLGCDRFSILVQQRVFAVAVFVKEPAAARNHSLGVNIPPRDSEYPGYLRLPPLMPKSVQSSTPQAPPERGTNRRPLVVTAKDSGSRGIHSDSSSGFATCRVSCVLHVSKLVLKQQSGCGRIRDL